MEGVFELPPGLLERPELADLRERVGEELEEVVLARRVSAEGRTRAFVQGRSATAADLQALGGRMVAFFGQHEHRRLTLASAQLDLLDGFCGPEAARAARPAGRRTPRMRELGGAGRAARARRDARPRPRPARVRDRGDRGARPERGGEGLACGGALAPAPARRPAGRRGGRSGGDCAERRRPRGGHRCWRGPRNLAQAVAGADPELDALAERLATLRLEAEDLGAELRRYAESLEAEPGRLEEVEERLELYDRLERKHGGSVAAVLAHAERCRAERERASRAPRSDRARPGGAARKPAASATGWPAASDAARRRRRRSSPSGCSRS